MTSSGRIIALLATANFAAATAGMIVAGILQLIATDLQWSTADAGRLITLYALGFAIGAPLLGAAFGTWCRKKTVMLGLSLVAFGSLGSALASQAIWLEAARVLVAAGSAMSIPSVSAIVAFLFPQERPRALALVLMGMTLAIVLGVPAGTLLASLYGWHAPLYGAAILAAVVALGVKVFLPGGIVVPPVPLRAWLSLLATARIYPLLALPIVSVAATFCIYGYIAPFTKAMLGINAQGLSWLLLWFGVVSLFASLSLGRISKSIDAKRILPMTIVGFVLCFFLLDMTAQRLWLAIVLFASWAVCNSFFGTLQQAQIVESVPSAASALLALNTSATFVGQALGTTIGGIVIQTSGVRELPLAGFALALGALVVYALSRKFRPSTA